MFGCQFAVIAPAREQDMGWLAAGGLLIAHLTFKVCSRRKGGLYQDAAAAVAAAACMPHWRVNLITNKARARLFHPSFPSSSSGPGPVGVPRAGVASAPRGCDGSVHDVCIAPWRRCMRVRSAAGTQAIVFLSKSSPITRTSRTGVTMTTSVWSFALIGEHTER